MPAETHFGVFEMGMNHKGEIAQLTRLVRPHVALVTAIAPAHIENLGSLEAIADAKAEIFEGLEPGGTAIIPFDSPYCARLADAARRHGAQVVTFGRQEGADVYARDVIQLDGGTMIVAVLPGVELNFTLSQRGDHWVSNALAVLAAVQAMGGDLAAAGLALGDMHGLKGRGERHRISLPKGASALLIDESYNANSASMKATLAVLGAESAARRIAVLGEMRELGENSEELHAELSAPVLDANVEIALLVGAGMAPLAHALGQRTKVLHLPDAASALQTLEPMLRDGDAILIKGSNAVGLGQLVDALTAGND
jgi:UDP-N-acetylmuramoyl-tripeptide--D-alanyl-D-alanine ligase